MRASVRKTRKVPAHFQQDYNSSGKSTRKKNRQERTRPYSLDLSHKQKKQDFFFPEWQSSLEQFALPENGVVVAWTGSRRLLLGVLQDALRSFFYYRSSRSRSGKRIFNETQDWLMSSELRWLYSFENVCAHLNLDPEYLRAGLRRFLQETEKPRPINGAAFLALSSNAQRRPFRLISGPGSRISRKSQYPAVQENAKKAKA